MTLERRNCHRLASAVAILILTFPGSAQQRQVQQNFRL